MLLRWECNGRVGMFFGRIDGYSGAHKAYRIVLRNIRRGKRWIQGYGLNILNDGDVLIWSHPPAQGPIQGKIILNVDVVINYHGQFTVASAKGPDSVNTLLPLPLELLLH